MEKLMKKYNNSRRNGGFSLVELIIVIAIMAALVAVLAPQYIKYIEKSRITADQATLDEYIKAVQVAVSDETVVYTPGKSITFTMETGNELKPSYANVAKTAGTNEKTLEDAINETFGNKKMVMKSTTGKTLPTIDSKTISITIDANGSVAWVNYPATWS